MYYYSIAELIPLLIKHKYIAKLNERLMRAMLASIPDLRSYLDKEIYQLELDGPWYSTKNKL